MDVALIKINYVKTVKFETLLVNFVRLNKFFVLKNHMETDRDCDPALALHVTKGREIWMLFLQFVQKTFKFSTVPGQSQRG
jgi:hypothetical protein